jgi:hypothetical protein
MNRKTEVAGIKGKLLWRVVVDGLSRSVVACFLPGEQPQ